MVCTCRRRSGPQVEKLAAFTSEILLRFGFEPMISLTMLTPRIVFCVISITYDRDIASDEEQAGQCYRELVRRCTEEGYYPYRMGIKSMGNEDEPNSYSALMHRSSKRSIQMEC